MTTTNLSLADIYRIAGHKLGTCDVACPACGPTRQSPQNQRRKVMRVWLLEPAFATFHCARCGQSGYVRDGSSPAPDPAKLARARAEAAAREKVAAAERLDLARWLWSSRRPPTGTIVNSYLDARGCHGSIPGTIGFLPARGEYGQAMIAAFGMVIEPEPGIIRVTDAAVTGVHITRLKADGSGKAETGKDKIFIGRSAGSPIVLAPVNDVGGLVIAEGIEKTLAFHQATGLGAWCAGSASRLPGLADFIPSYVSSVTTVVDDDHDGRRYAAQLASRLQERGFEVRFLYPSRWRAT